MLLLVVFIKLYSNRGWAHSIMLRNNSDISFAICKVPTEICIQTIFFILFIYIFIFI